MSSLVVDWFPACRPYNANEVFVTGTFDDWGKTVRLDRTGDVFEKEVRLPAIGDKVHYKVSSPSSFFGGKWCVGTSHGSS